MAVSAARDLPLGRGGDVSNFPRTVLTQAINQVDRAEGLWDLVSASPKVALPYPVSQGLAGKSLPSPTHLQTTSPCLCVGRKCRIRRVEVGWKEGNNYGNWKSSKHFFPALLLRASGDTGWIKMSS